MRHALVALLALLLAPAAARADYDPAGVYLDALNWTPISARDDVRLDADGIPQVERGDAYVYNPVTISQYGLQEFSHHAVGEGPEHLAAALRAADWLVAHQRSPAGTWTYDYDFPVSGMGVTLHAPWISAMAQGQAMSLLTRAWRATGTAAYLTAAQGALAPFRLSVADGGVVADFLGDATLPFYEEYPTAPASLTLNGFMFALIGLHDLDAAAPGGDAGTLFGQGYATLRAGLPRYDTGGVSAYHLGHLTNGPRNVHASLKYHWVHVVELDALNAIAPHSVVEHYRDRWAAYAPPPPRRPPPPPPVVLPPPPEPVVSDLRLVRAPHERTRRLAVRFDLTAPGSVALELTRCRDGRCRTLGRRAVTIAAGTQTVGLYRRGRRPLGSGRFRVHARTASSADRLRFRVQRSRRAGSSSSSAARTVSSSRIRLSRIA